MSVAVPRAPGAVARSRQRRNFPAREGASPPYFWSYRNFDGARLHGFSAVGEMPFHSCCRIFCRVPRPVGQEKRIKIAVTTENHRLSRCGDTGLLTSAALVDLTRVQFFEQAASPRCNLGTDGVERVPSGSEQWASGVWARSVRRACGRLVVQRLSESDAPASSAKSTRCHRAGCGREHSNLGRGAESGHSLRAQSTHRSNCW